MFKKISEIFYIFIQNAQFKKYFVNFFIYNIY